MSDEDPAGGPEQPEPGTTSDAPAEPSSEATGLSDALNVPDASAAEAFHRRARLAEDRLAEVLAAYRKLHSENEGYKERITKNLERRYDQRRERLLLKFIDILDNLDRALEAAEQSYAGAPLIEGLILVRTQLLQTLKDEGLERIPALGHPYDPTFSEAVEMRPVDDPDHHNLVVKEMLRGYRLNGRIARASRVAVGQYAGTVAATPPVADAPVEAPAAVEVAAIAETPPVESAPARESAPTGGEGEPSLDDIISRAEAQEALFPEAFEDTKKDGD